MGAYAASWKFIIVILYALEIEYIMLADIFMLIQEGEEGVPMIDSI